MIQLIFGILAESLYVVYALTIAKGIRERGKLVMFLLLTIFSFIILSNLFPYTFYFYVYYHLCIYMSMRVLYGKRVNVLDVFVIPISFTYLFIISSICYYFIPNFDLAVITHAVVLLLSVYAFKKLIRNCYIAYSKYWNIRKDSKIKSLTIRNISVFSLSVFIHTLNWLIVILFRR